MRLLILLCIVAACCAVEEQSVFAKRGIATTRSALKKIPVVRRPQKIPQPKNKPVGKKEPLTRVTGIPTRVEVSMKPEGVYVTSCVLGSVRGLKEQAEQGLVSPSQIISCLSSWDRRTRFTLHVQCSGGRLENESTSYSRDQEFIIRISCRL